MRIPKKMEPKQKQQNNETIIEIKQTHKDDRGLITNILDEQISHVAIITSKKGTVRGNHYHPEQIQFVYLITGRYESHSKNIKQPNSEVQTKIINPGNLVITSPMIAHAMKFLEDSVLLNLTTGGRDTKKYEEHTIKYKVI